MKSIKEKVRTLLKCYPKMRDSNELLYSEFLFVYVYKKDKRFLEVKLFDFLNGIEFANAPSFESIARLSRMIQMEEIELRGYEYDIRHEKQNKVKSDLGYGL